MTTIFTIEKALECKLLRNCSILTGQKGLDKEITRITVGEVPDLPRWLIGGELVLSTLFAFKDNRPGLQSFIHGLINAGASGLCIKTERFLNTIGEEIIEICNKHSFPIINVKKDVRWSDLMQNLYEAKLSEKIQMETEMKLRGDLLDELIESGSGLTGEDIIKRTSFLGFDISEGCLSIVIEADLPRVPGKLVGRAHEELYNYIVYSIKPLEHNSLIVSRKNSIAVFINPGSQERAEFIAKNLEINLRQRFKERAVFIGVSDFQDEPRKMLKAYQQAALAIEAASKLGKHGSITYFGELGTYKLLMKLAETDPDELNAFYKETIAPLADYDLEHDSQLVRTLETYLDKEQNIAEAAAAMFLHRHTVRYRLARIKEISGLDVLDSEDRERLSVGLKAMRLIGSD